MFPLNKDNNTYIIAEIGNNHEGDLILAKKLIKLAASCGCNAVKFQSIKPELLVGEKNIKRLDQLKRFELTNENYEELKRVSEEEKIDFLSTPFDLDYVDFLDKLVPAYKVSSGDLTYFQLLEKISLKFKPIILSTGMSTIPEIKSTINFIQKTWDQNFKKNNTIYILHCVSAYPTSADYANLNALKDLSRLGFPIGYSDHTIGTEAAVIAVSMGARIIEKHFTISKTHSEFRDHQLSADPKEMKKLVSKIRRAETLIGNKSKIPMKIEKDSLKSMRRSIFTKSPLKKGEILTEDKLICLRPGEGISPSKIYDLIGKRIKHDLEANEIIKETDIF
tara:strand:+ start:88 stop:1092 length:1005 start_codon:yes stop_codon:yes gene_type:complete